MQINCGNVDDILRNETNGRIKVKTDRLIHYTEYYLDFLEENIGFWNYTHLYDYRYFIRKNISYNYPFLKEHQVKKLSKFFAYSVAYDIRYEWLISGLSKEIQNVIKFKTLINPHIEYFEVSNVSKYFFKFISDCEVEYIKRCGHDAILKKQPKHAQSTLSDILDEDYENAYNVLKKHNEKRERKLQKQSTSEKYIDEKIPALSSLFDFQKHNELILARNLGFSDFDYLKHKHTLKSYKLKNYENVHAQNYKQIKKLQDYKDYL